MNTDKQVKTNILLIEDDVDFKKSLTDRLLKRNYSIIAVESAEKALELVQSEEFDIIISDIKLDGMDGLEFLSRIKKIDEDIPVILVTGFANIDTAKDAVALNAYSYIVKPLTDFSKLLVQLQNAAAGYILKKENKLIKERFENIVSSVPDGILTINNSLIIESVNKAFLKMFNTTERQVLNRHLKNFFDDKVLLNVKELMESIGHEDNSIKFEWINHLKKAENRIWANITVKRAIIGRKDTILLVVSDISDLKKAEEEKKNTEIQFIQLQKQESLGSLTHGIAHEFNNILSIILGHTQLCMAEVSLEEIKQSLAEIEKATIRGSKLVENMTSYATPHMPQLKAQDIREIINETINMQKRQLRLQNISIEKDFKNTLTATFDSGQMEQVFLNLIINAMHAIKPKGAGKISVSTSDFEDQIEIRFTDTGIGMDESTKLKIFDPFFTTKGAYSKDNLNITGTGLGLSVTKGIISQHHGTISVSSMKNEGTTFTIRIPAVSAALNRSEKTINVIEDHDLDEIRKMRILLVDDEEEMINLMELVFKKAGFQNIQIVNNGKSAIAVFRDFNPDIVFLDLIMPDMDGREIFRDIRKINRNTPIVFMSGKINLHKDEVMKEGPYDYIKKPFSITSLYNILTKVLKEKIN